ncbi:MAG: AAA family ATPase [Pseudomonadota bacterium]
MGKIIAIANQKGGVGKTTTAINLSSCISVSEKKTLLIDLDPQSNAGSGLGIVSRETKGSLYDLFLEPGLVSGSIYSTNLPYLDIIPSDQNLVGAEVELINKEGREFILKNIIAQVKDNYDFIFIDCPPSLSMLTVNALTAADSVLVPLQCEYYALEGIGRLLKTIKLIRKHLNPNLGIEGILLTMFDRRNNLSFQVERDIRLHLADRVFESIIPRNVKLSEAPSHGKPIILYDINSKGSISYFNLATELLERNCLKGINFKDLKINEVEINND